jgi:hypothetical protein
MHAYPHFTGCITIWGTTNPSQEYIKPLIRTQKKIIRLINNMPPGTHTKPLMTALKLLNITNLYTYRTSIEIHPFINNTNSTANRPEHNHQYVPVSHIHEHQTRFSQQQHQFIPNPWTHLRNPNKSPTHTMEFSTRNSSEIWNNLPLSIRDIKDLEPFKAKLKHYLLTKQNEQ